MTNQELIKKAASVIKSKKLKDGIVGDVGCALLSSKNKVYLGVSVDSGTSMVDAEQSAISAMILKGEYQIKKIVTVWKDEKDASLHVIGPCGKCRQFMMEINEKNLEAEVILDANKTVKLKKLLPHHSSWKKQK